MESSLTRSQPLFCPEYLLNIFFPKFPKLNDHIKFSFKTNVLHHSDSCLSNNKLLTAYLKFNNNPASLNYFLLSLEVRVSVAVLYLCFVLALKWKPPKKLIMYAFVMIKDRSTIAPCMIHVVTLANSTF